MSNEPFVSHSFALEERTRALQRMQSDLHGMLYLVRRTLQTAQGFGLDLAAHLPSEHQILDAMAAVSRLHRKD